MGRSREPNVKRFPSPAKFETLRQKKTWKMENGSVLMGTEYSNVIFPSAPRSSVPTLLKKRNGGNFLVFYVYHTGAGLIAFQGKEIGTVPGT